MGNNQAKTEVTPVVLPPFDFNHLKSQLVSSDTNNVKKQCLQHIELNQNPEACYLLGLYYFGLSKEWNVDLARKYLEMAIDKGNTAALVSYALFYYYGTETLDHNDKYTFRKAALPMKEWYRIGNYYLDNYLMYTDRMIINNHVKRDYNMSFQFLTIAIDSKDSVENLSIAYECLGSHYHYGLGVATNYKKALDNYMLAHDLLNKNPDFNHKKYYLPQINTLLRNIQDALFKTGEFKSDEVLAWMLKPNDPEQKDYNLRIAKIYEARGEYDLAIKYCSKQIVIFGKVGTFDESYDTKEYKKELLKKKKGYVPDEMKALKETVEELKVQIGHLTKLIPVAAVIEPPAYT
ncbi:MAG: hypothetical protein Harvfovirus56_7 [Harvfovirus sp.]|uniref:Sel1 repeat family protein n=1 Tax=Harvfovirus sp. TaxID=2487768 RepID=A0A3G5A3H9_9VIRU|nr:MAG: hypothetical protein Harvfovirus56_7 [Harvfovirus sp.]